LSNITPSERVVLQRFFGIEAADTSELPDAAEAEIDWNPAPEPVVPLNEAATLPLAFFSVRTLAVCLVLLIGVAAGAIALRARFKAAQQSAPAATVADSKPAATVADSQPSPVTEAQAVAEVKQVAEEPAAVKPEHRVTAEPEKPAAKVQDLTGEWQVINTVQKTAYQSFDNMTVGFRLKINQQGQEFTGSGEKFSENGQKLPAANRTPIHVTGRIDGDKAVATFVEEGSTRRTNGRFVWKVQNGGDQLAGTFVSTAANSSGKSALTKQQ
jgi:hypothetical protein